MKEGWSGQWLGLVLCVPFSALTLMVGGRMDIRPLKKTPHKKLHFANPQGSSSGTDGGGTKRNRLI